MPRLFFLAALAVATVLSGCDDTIFVDPCVEDPASCEPPGPEIIGGVNVSALLAPPSTEDLVRARQLWNRGAPSGYVGRLVDEMTAADGAQLYLLEARDAQSDTVVTYALARRPPLVGLPPSLPVLLIAPDLSDVTAGDFLTRSVDSPLGSSWIQVVAVPRGGTVSFRGVTREAPGPPSPYLFDVSDAIGVLTSARGSIPRATGRSAAIGFGRGGSVALFASARDARIRAVASLAAPADLFISDVRNGIRAVLDGRPAPESIPGFGAVAADVIVPLQAGEITMEEARAALLARSPAYFLTTLAPVVAFHGREDGVVTVVHGRRLEAALRAVPALDNTYVETDDVHNSLFNNFSVRGQAANHLDQASL